MSQSFLMVVKNSKPRIIFIFTAVLRVGFLYSFVLI